MMNHLVLLLHIFVCANLCSAIEPVRIMTYNVHNGMGLDGVRDYRRLVKMISDESPNIVCLQEVDSCTERSGKTYLLDSLSVSLGLSSIFCQAMEYDGGKYGVGLLAKREAKSIGHINLPGREEPRVALVAEFEQYYIVCTHFSLNELDRKAAAVILNGLTLMSEKPIILAGDLNSLPGEDPILILEHNYKVLNDKYTPTFPADNPTDMLDYIMIANLDGARSDSRVVNDAVTSDHRAVVVNIYPPTNDEYE